MSDYPMLISNKLHSFRNFDLQKYYLLGHLCYLCINKYQHKNKLYGLTESIY